jgi:hypothetical protein
LREKRSGNGYGTGKSGQHGSEPSMTHHGYSLMMDMTANTTNGNPEGRRQWRHCVSPEFTRREKHDNRI